MKKTTIAEKLEAYTVYIPETSCVVWIGSVTNQGYGSLREGKKMLKAHRAAYMIAKGPIPAGMVLDHICHVPGCVNPDHLRVCTPSDNAKNRKLEKTNSSGLKGVGWAKRHKRWRAQISVNGKNRNLGMYKTKEEAYAAYCDTAKDLHGEFFNPGF